MTEHIATDREQIDKVLVPDPSPFGWADRLFVVRLDKQLCCEIALSADQRRRLDEIVRERT